LSTKRSSDVDGDAPTLEWPADRDLACGPGRPSGERTTNPLVLVAEQALDAQVECEQARRLADARAVLADQARQDGEELTDTELDRRAEEVCYQERREGFAAELVARAVPDPETVALACELDGHVLRLWLDVATSLADELPPSLQRFSAQVATDRRAEQHTRAELVRADADAALRRRVLGRWAWLWRRGALAGVRAEQRTCALRGRPATTTSPTWTPPSPRSPGGSATGRAGWPTPATSWPVGPRRCGSSRAASGRRPPARAKVADRRGRPPAAPGAGGVVSPRKAPARRCTWRQCAKPASARVRFELPNLLAGAERDYCTAHTREVCRAPGTRVARHLGPRRPAAAQLGLPGIGGGARPATPATGHTAALATREP